MYLTSSTLAMDQEQLAGVENANINSGESGSEAEQEEEEEQQEQQETAQPQEEQQQEKQQEQQPQQGSTYVNQPVTSDALSGSLLSLIQKNQTSSSTGSDGSGSDGPGEGSGEGGGSGGGETGNLPHRGRGRKDPERGAGQGAFHHQPPGLSGHGAGLFLYHFPDGKGAAAGRSPVYGVRERSPADGCHRGQSDSASGRGQQRLCHAEIPGQGEHHRR